MKIKIHPLFYGVMLLCALFGGLTATLICLVTALLHESGHIFCAARMGFKCECVKIMPYGAAAVCDIDGIKPADEVRLALAGPLVNAAICVFLAGLWWFIPEAYAYTDTVMTANLAMLVVNLLPAYPLDGGRVAGCLLRKLFGKRVAEIALKTASGLGAVGLIAAFFLTGYNPTLLFFALFLVCSVFERPQEMRLINFAHGEKLKRGMEEKRVLCDETLTFKDAFRLLDDRRYLVLKLYGTEETVTQDELYERATLSSVYDEVFGYFCKNERENIDFISSPEEIASTSSAPKDTESSTAPESEA